MKWLINQIFDTVKNEINELIKDTVFDKFKFGLQKQIIKRKSAKIIVNFTKRHGEKEYYNNLDQYLFENNVIYQVIKQSTSLNNDNNISTNELAYTHTETFVQSFPRYKLYAKDIFITLNDLFEKIFELLNTIPDENIQKAIRTILNNNNKNDEIINKKLDVLISGQNRIEKKIDSISIQLEESITEQELAVIIDKAFNSERKANPSIGTKTIDSNPFSYGIDIKHEVVAKINKMDFMPLNSYFKECWRKSYQNHLSITGIGGIGKTVVLLETNYPVPTIYIPIRSLNFNANNCIVEYIKSITLNSDNRAYNSLLKLCDKKWLDKPHVIILLDGINEVNPSEIGKIFKEIESFWVKRSGVQLIITSRYDINNRLNIKNLNQVLLQPLSEETIKNYLNSRNIDVPSKGNKLWKVIDTPLMLRLYADTNEIKMTHKSPYAKWTNTNNAGSIIWNYLQSELCNISNLDPLECVAAIHYVAPYICYKMSNQNTFEISNQIFNNLIYDATNRLNRQICARKFPNSISSIDIPKHELNDLHFAELLINKFKLFHCFDNKIQLSHQHFRDCLAAIFIIQTADNAEEIPHEWKLDFDAYVSDFVIDLIISERESNQNELWKKIWAFGYQKTPNTHAFTKKMLNIYRKAYNEDISTIDFSGVDLTRIPLNTFKITMNSKNNFVNAIVGKETFFGNGHSDTVSATSWSHNEEYYISASHDCTIRIYYPNNNVSQILNNKHKHYIRCAACSPVDSNVIASAGDDQELICWKRNRKITTINQTLDEWIPEVLGTCDDWIRSIKWDGQGKRIVCGDGKGNIRLFYQNGFTDFEHKHTSNVRHISWLNKWNVIASGSDDGIFGIWTENGKCVYSHKLSDPITAVSWLQDGAYLMVSTYRVIQFFNVKFSPMQDDHFITLRKIKEIPGDNISCITSSCLNSIDHIAIFDNNNLTIYGFQDTLGDLQFDEIGSCRYEGETNKIITAEWNKKCDKIICGSRDGSVSRIDVKVTEENFERIIFNTVGVRCSKAARCSCWSPNGKWLAVGYDDCSIRIWEPLNKRCIAVLTSHHDSIKSLSWSPNSKYLVSGSDDNSVKLWIGDNITELRPHVAFTHKEPVNAVLWLNNNCIVSAGDDKQLVLTYLNKQEHIINVDHSQRVYSLAVSPNKEYIISGGNDNYLIMWNTETFQSTKINSHHLAPVRALAWAPNGKYIISSSNDGTINLRLFDIEANALNLDVVQLPKMHNDFIYGASISGNNLYAVGGSSDSTVGFWDINSKSFIFKSEAHKDFIWNVSSSPQINNKYYIATSSSDGTVKIWDVSDGNKSIIEPSCSLPVIPESDIIGCDLCKAIIKDQELKDILLANGAIIDT